MNAFRSGELFSEYEPVAYQSVSLHAITEYESQISAIKNEWFGPRNLELSMITGIPVCDYARNSDRMNGSGRETGLLSMQNHLLLITSKFSDSIPIR